MIKKKFLIMGTDGAIHLVFSVKGFQGNLDENIQKICGSVGIVVFGFKKLNPKSYLEENDLSSSEEKFLKSMNIFEIYERNSSSFLVTYDVAA